MDVIKISHLFSPVEVHEILKNFKDSSNNSLQFSISEDLGRSQFGIRPLDISIEKKILQIAKTLCNFDCEFSGATGAEYNSKYGRPALPPHFDGDWNELIINYQLISNTQWDIGVDLNVYEMQDNSAIVFHPNENIHWRPKKEFKAGEFVKMVFFRFYNSKNKSDYSHLRYSQDHEIFKEANNIRDRIFDE